jgi:hypothetical protein
MLEYFGLAESRKLDPLAEECFEMHLGVSAFQNGSNINKINFKGGMYLNKMLRPK